MVINVGALVTVPMRIPGGEVADGRWGRWPTGGSLSKAFAVGGLAVFVCCTTLTLIVRKECRPSRADSSAVTRYLEDAAQLSDVVCYLGK